MTRLNQILYRLVFQYKIQSGGALVGHELESLSVSETSSNQIHYSFDAQEVGSQTNEEFSAAQQQHLAAYYYRQIQFQ